jgi:hypothetical protein
MVRKVKRSVWQCLVWAALGAMSAPTAARAETILFVGNSFTFGALSPVRAYRPDLVTDLNGEGIGGVPALVATFASEAGLHWQISLETSPGADLQFHYDTMRDKLARRWDVVLLQGYSTLSKEHPGDPSEHVAAAARLAAMFKHANPRARIDLVTSWSRADQTYRPTGHWSGKPISAMVEDIAAANALAIRTDPDIEGAIPVGQAWNRAMDEGVADPNPYDGVAFGQLDLWATDQYHASAYGYYLEALVIFGSVSGRDPRALGAAEKAGFALGFSAEIVVSLQRIAAEELLASGKLTPAR